MAKAASFRSNIALALEDAGEELILVTEALSDGERDATATADGDVASELGEAE